LTAPTLETQHNEDETLQPQADGVFGHGEKITNDGNNHQHLQEDGVY
jgi:hypothetical protein